MSRVLVPSITLNPRMKDEGGRIKRFFRPFPFHPSSFCLHPRVNHAHHPLPPRGPAAVKKPNVLAEIARKFGTCATVLGLDANRVKDDDGRERWEVFINGGRTPTGIDVLEWSKRAEALGAGEIVLNVMNADGTTSGY